MASIDPIPPVDSLATSLDPPQSSEPTAYPATITPVYSDGAAEPASQDMSKSSVPEEDKGSTRSSYIQSEHPAPGESRNQDNGDNNNGGMTSVPKPPLDTTVPSSPSPATEPTSPTITSPQISLVLLLVSGRRRTMSFPAIDSTTVLRAKELIWNSWPAEWKDEQPPAPGFLRLLHLGKIWGDDDLLTSEWRLCFFETRLDRRLAFFS